ncbi:hypothetical protein EDC04DRAFT_3146517 [Pisolithus marmoratus]|nr:hypothetical protein EDC04DRAFT_3146517 [Pisolithus marmoratus]
MALPLKLSYIELQNANNIESVDFELNDAKYTIARSQERGDTFSKKFNAPLTLETESLSFTISRKKQRCPCLSPVDPEIVTIRLNDVRSKLNGQESLHEWNKVSIKLRFLPQTQPTDTAPSAGTTVPKRSEASMPTTEQRDVTHSPSAPDTVGSAGTTVLPNMPAPAPSSAPGNHEGLRPTTEELIAQCPRFRVLVVGKSGVGKSSLINRIFGVQTAEVAAERPGEAEIEREFIPSENNRLILHDSKGFEPGDSGNYDIVKSFIEKRNNMRHIKDQLHVVWLCFQIPIPTFGERLLEDAAEAFLKIKKEVLGNTLTIVVFTKYDRLVSFMRQKMLGDPEAVQRYMQEYCIQPIQDFTGDKAVSTIAVSSKPKYEQSLKALITLTQDMVSSGFASPENQVSAVPLAAAGAQRMLPTLKIALSIDVGKQRYWQALGSSTNFLGYKMEDCLHVIHVDIVSVWNFYDPCRYLNSEKFRNLIMHMVGKVDETTELTHQPSRKGTLDGGFPLIALVPVILPLSAFVSLGKWVYESYQQHLQGVHKKFMAHIVDLTHVLEILFSLTEGMTAKKLTRTAIKLAYKAYCGSEWMNLTHTDIRSFECWSTARDVVLDKITSMISSDGREARVSRAIASIRESMPSVDLEKDEEWVDEEASQ